MHITSERASTIIKFTTGTQYFDFLLLDCHDIIQALSMTGLGLNTAAIAIIVPALLTAHLTWTKRVQEAVPEPYLDEFFHIPQANAFWQGNWSHWDDKITTPPGVYLWSILFSKCYWADAVQSKVLSTYQARITNVFLPYALAICVFVLERQSTRRGASKTYLSPRQLSVFTFPLVFFFSGLYYTDVFSVLTVMCTYAFWKSSVHLDRGPRKFSLQVLVLASGLTSLASRQTNIFWVAVFLGGLQAVHTVNQVKPIYDPSLLTSFEGMFGAPCCPKVHCLNEIRLSKLTNLVDCFCLQCYP